MDKLKIEENIDIKPFTTLKLGGKAQFFARIKNSEDLKDASDFAKAKNLNFFPLGGGSNIVVGDDISGMLWAKVESKGIEIIKETLSDVYIKVSAGEVWDDLVDFTVSKGWAGLEALSLIPGTAGATPVQNVGAYGTEVSRVIEEISFFDQRKSKTEIMEPSNAMFGYRDSVFKHELKGKAVIESIVFKLSKKDPEIPQYPSVLETVEEILKSENSSLLQSIRNAIIKIRKSKLPDPNILPSVGSFFGNPIISKDDFERLKLQYPDIKFFEATNGFKIPAGWLIQKAGLKGYRIGNVGTSPDHALVLVNYGTDSTKELLDFAFMIQDNIYSKFGIRLEIEPEIV